MIPKPSENGTYRSSESSSNPSDNRGQQRFDVRCRTGEVGRLRPAEARRIFTDSCHVKLGAR